MTTRISVPVVRTYLIETAEGCATSIRRRGEPALWTSCSDWSGSMDEWREVRRILRAAGFRTYYPYDQDEDTL